jgi:DNA polymerase delta subunit 4
MPSTRRQSAGLSASKAKAKPKAAGQTKLAFHGQNRVTKAVPPALDDKKKLDVDEEIEAELPKVASIDVEEPESADSSLVEVTVPEKKSLDAAEQRASKVSDAQIKKYWAEKEKARKSPRVHQEGLTIHEKLLREWDTDVRYGVGSYAEIIHLEISH